MTSDEHGVEVKVKVKVSGPGVYKDGTRGYKVIPGYNCFEGVCPFCQRDGREPDGRHGIHDEHWILWVGDSDGVLVFDLGTLRYPKINYSPGPPCWCDIALHTTFPWSRSTSEEHGFFGDSWVTWLTSPDTQEPCIYLETPTCFVGYRSVLEAEALFLEAVSLDGLSTKLPSDPSALMDPTWGPLWGALEARCAELMKVARANRVDKIPVVLEAKEAWAKAHKLLQIAKSVVYPEEE